MVACRTVAEGIPAGREGVRGAGDTGFPPPGPALPSHGPLPTPIGEETGAGLAWSSGFSGYCLVIREEGECWEGREDPTG